LKSFLELYLSSGTIPPGKPRDKGFFLLHISEHPETASHSLRFGVRLHTLSLGETL